MLPEIVWHRTPTGRVVHARRLNERRDEYRYEAACGFRPATTNGYPWRTPFGHVRKCPFCLAAL